MTTPTPTPIADALQSNLVGYVLYGTFVETVHALEKLIRDTAAWQEGILSRLAAVEARKPRWFEGDDEPATAQDETKAVTGPRNSPPRVEAPRCKRCGGELIDFDRCGICDDAPPVEAKCAWCGGSEEYVSHGVTYRCPHCAPKPVEPKCATCGGSGGHTCLDCGGVGLEIRGRASPGGGVCADRDRLAPKLEAAWAEETKQRTRANAAEADRDRLAAELDAARKELAELKTTAYDECKKALDERDAARARDSERRMMLTKEMRRAEKAEAAAMRAGWHITDMQRAAAAEAERDAARAELAEARRVADGEKQNREHWEHSWYVRDAEATAAEKELAEAGRELEECRELSEFRLQEITDLKFAAWEKKRK